MGRNSILSKKDEKIVTGLLVNMPDNGLTHQDIADRYKVSRSTINKMKSRLKEEGVVFAEIKGKRPIPSRAVGTAVNTTKAVTGYAPRNTSPVAAGIPPIKMKNEQGAPSSIQITVNGIPLLIDGTPANVSIKEDHLIVNYGKHQIKVFY